MTDEKKPDAKVKVRFKRRSHGLKRGATRTLPKATAERLIAQGHAEKA